LLPGCGALVATSELIVWFKVDARDAPCHGPPVGRARVSRDALGAPLRGCSDAWQGTPNVAGVGRANRERAGRYRGDLVLLWERASTAVPFYRLFPVCYPPVITAGEDRAPSVVFAQPAGLRAPSMMTPAGPFPAGVLAGFAPRRWEGKTGQQP
jgi:hypothetical protein